MPGTPPPPPRLNPKKLLLGKWTAVQPVAKERHFIVTRRVRAVGDAGPPPPIVDVVIEALHSGRCTTLAWRELTDTTRWRQGWR